MADLIEQEKSLLSELSAADRQELARLLRRMLAPLESRAASRADRPGSPPLRPCPDAAAAHACACWNSRRLPTGSLVWKRRRPGMASSHVDGRPGGLDRVSEPVEPTGRRHGQSGVRLAGRGEALLDADVDLGRARAEPRAPTGAQPLRLVDLGHAEHAAVERAHGVLAARRTGHLDVVQPHLHATKVS